MIKISILYPNRKGSRFDMNYYLNTHMPMSIERLGTAKGFRGVSVERGLSGISPESEPTYIAMGHFLFDSLEDFLGVCREKLEARAGQIIHNQLGSPLREDYEDLLTGRRADEDEA
jgi:uncharacterized protein (TIGR02118 family)